MGMMAKLTLRLSSCFQGPALCTPCLQSLTQALCVLSLWLERSSCLRRSSSQITSPFVGKRCSLEMKMRCVSDLQRVAARLPFDPVRNAFVKMPLY